MSKSITIDIPEGYEIDRTASTFEKIVFQKLAPQYPTHIREVKERSWYITSGGKIESSSIHNDINQVSSIERIEAFLALMQLVELRDTCNEIDGNKNFVLGTDNYVIELFREKVRASISSYTGTALHFRKESTRDWFLQEHKELIEQAKELI